MYLAHAVKMRERVWMSASAYLTHSVAHPAHSAEGQDKISGDERDIPTPLIRSC